MLLTFLLSTDTADQALIGYCKIIAEINRNKYVIRYRNEPKLTDNGKHEFKVHTYTICLFESIFISVLTIFLSCEKNAFARNLRLQHNTNVAFIF